MENIKLLIISIVLAITSIFQMGYTNAYPNTAISSFRLFLNESYHKPMEMNNSEFEWFWSALLALYFIGFATGSIISADIADRIGRKWTLVLGTMGSLTSAIIALFSVILKSSLIFGISRLVMSLFASISMNAIILLFQESSPDKMKGIISFNAEMAFVVTNLIGGLFGMQMVLGNNLIALIVVSIIPSTISCFLSVFLYESPKFLYFKRNDSDEASRSLKFYQNVNEHEQNSILQEFQIEKDNLKNNNSISILTVFTTQPYRRGFLLGFATMQLTTSIWPILFYSTDFLVDVGFSYNFAENISTLMLFVSTISTVIGMFAVENFSRKWLLTIAATFNMIAVLGFSIFSITSKIWYPLRYGCIPSLIIHGISYSVALGPIAWFITSELVPMSCRAMSQSLVLALNHSIALVLTFLTFPLYKLIGPIILIIFFFVPGTICILLLVFYLPETKNQHINDIVNKLRNNKNKRVENITQNDREK